MLGYTPMNWEDPRVVKTRSVLLLVIMSALVAYNIYQPPHGPLGWIAVFFFGMAGAFCVLALILSFEKPKV